MKKIVSHMTRKTELVLLLYFCKISQQIVTGLGKSNVISICIFTRSSTRTTEDQTLPVSLFSEYRLDEYWIKMH